MKTKNLKKQTEIKSNDIPDIISMDGTEAEATEQSRLEHRKSGRTVKRLFGTDGIRGTSGQFPIRPDIILKVGQALGHLLQKNHKASSPPVVVIGKDTRLSGYMVEQALASGLNSTGVHVRLIGPLPTPGIGFLAQNMRASAGVIISASHNAYHDNGVKIFGSDGFKISDEMEQAIEEWTLDKEVPLVSPELMGRTKRIDDAAGRYIVYAKNSFPLDLNLEGMRIVLDCAHGAGYKVAPLIFEELGAEVIVTGNKPDGFNINSKVGALHPEKLAQDVLRYRADVGIALDGDADRVIMIDEKGRVLNGDHILAACALFMKRNKQLKNNTIVATQMSNIGLDIAMEKYGIKVVRTGVGDKLVVEQLRKGGWSLGGEQSGHIIFLDHSTTGDGCVAALRVLGVMRKEKKALSEVSGLLKELPQVLINIKATHRFKLEDVPGYKDLRDDLQKSLGEGRLFVRFSGTESKIRILVEGKDSSQIEAVGLKMKEFLQAQMN